MSTGLQRVPVQEATLVLIEACALVGTAEREHDEFGRLLALLLSRRDQSVPCDLITDAQGPAGWVGLVPYGTVPGSWQSSTFFAPRLRGSGLFAQARCWQAHMAHNLRVVHPHNLRVVSSIAQWNTQSLTASARYATRHGWPDTWRNVDEPHRNRVGVVIDWPLPVPHTCFLPEEAASARTPPSLVLSVSAPTLTP